MKFYSEVMTVIANPSRKTFGDKVLVELLCEEAGYQGKVNTFVVSVIGDKVNDVRDVVSGDKVVVMGSVKGKRKQVGDGCLYDLYASSVIVASSAKSSRTDALYGRSVEPETITSDDDLPF